MVIFPQTIFTEKESEVAFHAWDLVVRIRKVDPLAIEVTVPARHIRRKVLRAKDGLSPAGATEVTGGVTGGMWLSVALLARSPPSSIGRNDFDPLPS